MISCPSCQQPVEVLEQHKGTLYTCPHCNSVYFIDWNGQPEVAELEAPVEPPSEFSVPSFQSSEQSFENPEPAFGETPEALDSDVYGEQAAESFGEHPVGFEAPAPEEEAPYDFSSTLDSLTTSDELSNAPTSDTSDFSDVTQFGNSDMALSSLSYSIVIEGLESSQILHQLKEAMTDSRFRWDVSAMMKAVRGGRLVISGLGPAKASVFINRIKYLPIKISWRQDVLSGN